MSRSTDDHETVADATRVLGRDLKPWESLYVVGTIAGASGWVVGDSVYGRADIQPFDAPTMFDGRAPSNVVPARAIVCRAIPAHQ
jgi:hypothetical protein